MPRIRTGERGIRRSVAPPDASVRTCSKDEIVQVWDVIDSLLPVPDVFIEEPLWYGLLVTLPVGCFEKFPHGEAVVLEVVFHRHTEDAHVTPPDRHRP